MMTTEMNLKNRSDQEKETEHSERRNKIRDRYQNFQQRRVVTRD